MPPKTLRKDFIESFLVSMIYRDLFSPQEGIEEFTKNLQYDIEILALLEGTRCLNPSPLPSQRWN
jgi:hypothetical protein